MKESSVYDYVINLEDKNSTVFKQLDFIGFDKKVLEFGCSTGYVSKILKERGCAVTGIEIDEEAAKTAEAYCERVIVGDIETIDYNKQLSNEKFDVALFGDILEHLKNPKTILLKVKDFLKEKGYIVISIPNIAHWSTRLDLLCGKFDYQELGILDDTHLRFFTKISIINLLESCGYYVSSIDGVRQDVDWVKVSTIMRLKGLNAADIKNFSSILNDPEAGVFQYVIKAIPSAESEYLKKISAENSSLEERILNLEGQITNISGQLDEKERQINELNAAVQGRIEHIQNFERQITDISSQLNEKQQQTNELNVAVHGKDAQIRDLDRQIADFSSQLTEKEQQINDLNVAIQGKDERVLNLEGQITNISSQLTEKEQQINDLNVAIQGKDERVLNLEGQITNISSHLKEKEQQIEELNVAVREKDTQLRYFDELKTTISSYIKEKDKQMDELDITIQESDEQIRDLEEQITDLSGRQKEKEQRITELNVAVQGKDKQILNLDGQIANISGQRKEREERLGEIEMENVRIDSELNSIKSSVTWRTMMKWHSFVETVMPQGTNRRRWYDQRLIRLRTSANEDGRISSGNEKEHRASKEIVQSSVKSTKTKAPKFDIHSEDLEKIQNIYNAKYGGDFISDIDKRDEMYQFLVNEPSVNDPIAEYFYSGELLLTGLQEVFEDLGYSFNQIDTFLDFACGYGRFTRFLIQKLNHEKITVSDIDKNAVDFVKSTFGVNGFYSVDNPDRLIHDTRYDVIFVASLFSHLSLRFWCDWLKRLYDLLNDGGILIFSTHGVDLIKLLNDEMKVLVQKVEEGFYYVPLSETKRLSTKDYGSTYVSYDYAGKVIRQNNIGKIVAYYPKKLHNFQDIYIIKKDVTKIMFDDSSPNGRHVTLPPPEKEDGIKELENALAKKDAKIGELEASLQDRNQPIQLREGEVTEITNAIVQSSVKSTKTEAPKLDLLSEDLEKIQNIYNANYGDDFISDIDKRDEMYQFLVNCPSVKDPTADYFGSGELMRTNLQEVFDDLGYSFNQIDTFLDFACGYGRFTRFLVQKLKNEKITVSDIDKNAVDFVKRTFGVNGFYSVDYPDRLIHATKYDVIFVASLFTHLPLRLWGDWLKRLYDFLNDGGILIFSTHGMNHYYLLDDEAKTLVEKVEEGFYYLPKSFDTERLSAEFYGTTYVTYDYVGKFIRQNDIRGKMVAYYPKKLCNFQDIYVIKKDNTKTSTIKLRTEGAAFEHGC